MVMMFNTKDYTRKQLQDFADGFSYVLCKVYASPECEEQEHCTPNCKAYAICEDLRKARNHIWNKIQEREALELR